jgi:tRNA (guanine-N7-)-methyltransferase
MSLKNHSLVGAGFPRPKCLEKPIEFFPSDPPWDSNKEWVLEIGPGKGEFLLWVAEENPEILCIGIEIKKSRFLKIVKKLSPHPDPLPKEREKTPNNILLIKGDARQCLPKIFETGCLTEVYILFPDPWPKRRHHKHRLLKPEIVEQVHTFLKPGGRIWIATDHSDYSAQIKSVFPSDRWSFKEGRSLYPTYFETKWKNLGREIYYFCFERK